jgi:hypothetical protein
MAEDDLKHCCFCFELVSIGYDSDGLTLRIEQQSRTGFQVLYAHADCLRSHADSRVPLVDLD